MFHQCFRLSHQEVKDLPKKMSVETYPWPAWLLKSTPYNHWIPVLKTPCWPGHPQPSTTPHAGLPTNGKATLCICVGTITTTSDPTISSVKTRKIRSQWRYPITLGWPWNNSIFAIRVPHSSTRACPWPSCNHHPASATEWLKMGTVLHPQKTLLCTAWTN